MIWFVQFTADKRQFDYIVVPAIADSPDEAIEKARRISQCVTGTLKETAQRLHNDYARMADNYLERAFTRFGDYAAHNDSVSDDEFNAGIDHYHETSEMLCDILTGQRGK